MKLEEAKDIVYGLKPDYTSEPQFEKLKAGPNRWQFVKNYPRYFGDCYDFRILDQVANEGVFMPTCIATQEWIRSKVSEDQHWYSDLDGKYFGVYVTRLDHIREAAERDGLVDKDDYDAMGNQEIENQGYEQ